VWVPRMEVACLFTCSDYGSLLPVELGRVERPSSPAVWDHLREL